MAIDPKQIAKMITEDPDEVNPLDNIEDRYLPTCDICGNEDPNILRAFEADNMPEFPDDDVDLHRCEMCRQTEICEPCIRSLKLYDDKFGGQLICPNCKKSEWYRESLSRGHNS